MQQPWHARSAWRAGLTRLTQLAPNPGLARGALWLGCWLVLGLHALIPGLMPQSAGDARDAVAWAVLSHVLSLISLLGLVLLYQHGQQRYQREIDQRHAQLRQMQHTLAETQKQQQAFMASVGHELRTPLNGILGLNGQLRQALADRPEDVEAADHIRGAAQTLLQTVNDLLDLSQLQAGQLALCPQDMDLPALLQQTLDSHRPQLREQGLDGVLQCDAGVPVRVHADGQRLRQVLDKLIGQAIGSTRQGRIAVRVCMAGGKVRFEVEATGPGLGQAWQQRLFSPWQEDDAQTPPAPTAAQLSLRLCEELVRLQAGQMGVRSQPGQGSLIWFELPLPPAQAAPAGVPADERLPASEPLKILLVDDNAVNLQVAGLQLRQLWPQCEVVSVDNAAQALREIDARQFDVALVDVAMPGMDGLTLTRTVRERHGHAAAALPILALTANSQLAEHQRCLAAGMNAVLLKPIEPQRLARSISALVREARA